MTKAVLSEGGLRPPALFLNKCKTNKQMFILMVGPGTTALMVTVCPASDLGFLLNLDGPRVKKQTSRFLLFSSKQQGTDSKLFIQHPEE